MELPKLSRTYSDKYVAGKSEYDLFMNKNVDWFGAPFLNTFYIGFILIFWGILHMSQLFSFEDTWTVANMVHGVVTFIIFHWVKGNPDESSQGEYNAFTLYEQIDAGIPWTATKKFLMLVPTVLTWIACYAADYKPFYIIVNVAIFFICIIAKLPQMHGVRILGINSTPGIDNPIQLSEQRDSKKWK